MANSETLTFKLFGIFEMSASGTLAIVAATILAAAVIIHRNRA